jgi:hypothetical protein
MAHIKEIEALAAEWVVLARSREGREAAAILSERSEATAAYDACTLRQLLDAMHQATGVEQRTQAAQVVADSLANLDAHPLLPRFLLQALVPGLLSVAKKLDWGQGGPWENGTEFWADLMAELWAVMADWSGTYRQYAAGDLLNAVRMRLRRRLVAPVREVPSSDLPSYLRAVDRWG